MKRYTVLIFGVLLLPLFINCSKNPTGSDNNEKTVSLIDSVTDADGNMYHAILLGTQTWTVENLKTTKFNDGTAMSLVADSAAWCNLTTEGYCWYANDAAANKNTYGALYNWYAVNSGKLAPAGWHVPSDSEWHVLENYLIADGYNWDGTHYWNKIGKSMAAKTNWTVDLYPGSIGNDLSQNNRSGFSGLPGSFRDNNATFYGIGYYGYWWSSTEYSATGAFAHSLGYYGEDLYNGGNYKSAGMSVRLVKD
jgi:uncharacterized protein (TIGR02145 family)